MFIALFAFVLVTVYAADEIPSYIKVCGRNNPNYGQCIADSINNVKSKACTGMPEFKISPIEPLTMDKITFYDTDNLKLFLEDSKIRGFCDFDIKSFHISPDKLQFDFDVVLKHLEMDSVYDFDIRLLVSLANKGKVHISSDNVDGKISIYLKEETKNGKTEIYASKVNTVLKIKSFKFEFDDSEKDLVQLHEVLRNTITENEKEIVNIFTPIVEKKVSEIVISVTNNVTRNKFEQLFPNEA